MKNEFQPIGGPIKDISWSPDNQRMVVVGEGRERYAIKPFTLKVVSRSFESNTDYFEKLFN